MEASTFGFFALFSGLSACKADYHLEDPKSLAAFLKHADIRLVRAECLLAHRVWEFRELSGVLAF